MSQIAVILHLRRARVALMDTKQALDAEANLGELGPDLAKAVAEATALVDRAGVKLRDFRSQYVRRWLEAGRL